MEIVIKIGREVEDNDTNLLVPPTFKRVSRRHATLFWHDGTVTIEDNESANGTYVNGKRIAKTKVTENDTVWLGGNNGGEGCYQLDMKKIFETCKETEKKAKTDYSAEFEDLKQAYNEYKEAVAKVKNSQNVKQRAVNFIPMLLGAIAAVPNFSLPPWSRFVFLGIGAAITLILMARNNKHDIGEDITELQIKYQPRYCCPKCGMKYPFTTHWKKLEADGKCPNPKCDARFVKQEQ